MKIRWIDDVQIEIVESFDEEQDEINETSIETFKKGEVHDVDILEERFDTDEKWNTVDMQFGDGSVGYAIPKKWFEEVKE